MRFPINPLMEPVFRLFHDIGLDSKLLPYYFSISDRNVLNFNHIRLFKDDRMVHTAEAFKIPDIPYEYSSTGWQKLLANALEPFRQALLEDFNTGGSRGWELLMQYDKYSTRGYLVAPIRRPTNTPDLHLFPYPSRVVDWMETFNTSSNSWTYSFSDTVLESLAFDWPNLREKQEWRCVACVFSVWSSVSESFAKC